MTSIPSSLARVPNLFSSQMMLGNLNRSNVSLLQLQAQLGTGLSVLRPSDDAVASSTIGSLNDVIERRSQQLINLQQADSLLATLDQSLGDVNDLILEAKGVGLSQIGIGSDAETRANQAQVINSILESLVSVANRDHRGIHYFGGQSVGAPPMEEMLGVYRYQGVGDGMMTDTGLAAGLEVTMAAERALGAMSARVRGLDDLNPRLSPETRLSDLRGARGLGVEPGSIQVNVSGTDLVIDLSDAETVADVIQTMQNQIKTIDPLASVAIDPTDGQSLFVVGFTGPITISDLEGDSTAADLGLTGTYPVATGGVGGDLDAILTELTSMDSLPGLTVPMGTIRLENGGQIREVDLSGVTTVGELVSKIESLEIGIRVEVDPDGRRLNFRNELSGASMSISEVGGGQTATQLGIRSLAGGTLLSDFNSGRGVDSVSGGFDPITGLPDPSLDQDFRITLGDGSSFETDISGASTVDEVLTAINDAAAAAGLAVPGAFEARLRTDGNGIELVDGTGGGGGITVERLNNSGAAEDLGILGSSEGAVLAGSDRAQVAADGLFSHLIMLRDALMANDEAGIAFATESLDEDVLRAAEARAEVGVRSRRVTDSINREEDLMVQDQSLLSNVRDLDFAEAATRYALLEQQLQASMMTISRSQQLSLLDFLR
jgi:flagellin-like hook-associated protein FlgL